MNAAGAVRNDHRRAQYDGISPLGRAVAQLCLGEPRNVVVVVGSADSLDAADTNRLDRLFQAGLAPLCKELDAAVVYGGTRAGVMQLVGMAMAEFAPGLPLVGVAPKGLVSFGDDAAPEAEVDADPHHTHFVLAPAGPWTSEAEVLIGVAERLAQGKRVVMLVIGGGDGTQRETELACERSWPVLAVDGIRGVSSDIAARIRGPASQSDHDPVARSIAAGAVAQVRVDDLHGFRRLLNWNLSRDDLLKEAWLRYAQVDDVATNAKPTLRRWKRVLLGLGVVTTTISITVDTLPEHLRDEGSALLVLVTSVSAAIVAFIARRRRDARWLSLRAAAEAVAREIYRYRTRAGTYWVASQTDEDQLLLASSLASIDARLSAQTALGMRPKGSSAWPPQLEEGVIDPADELLPRLDGHTYDAVRVEDQIRYFNKQSARINRRIDLLLVVVYVAGVIATVMGAMAADRPYIGSWIAVVVAMSAAFLSWLDSEQFEQQTTQMASTAAGIRAARERWLALPSPVNDQEAAERVSRFAGEVEESLESEAVQWERALRQAHQSFLAGVGNSP